jgi:large subunit ribosomal protein L25
MATQVTLNAEVRDAAEKGKGAAGRLRRAGRVPAVVYGSEVEPTPLHVDALELYHAMRTEAGANVLIRLNFAGDEYLSIVREIQRHAVRGDMLHVDFVAVDRNQLYPADVPVHLENEDDPRTAGGIVNLVLHAVPILVKPLEVPTNFTLDLAGLEIGDVLRVADLTDQLPEGASFDLDEERTVVTINAPVAEVEEEPAAEGEEALAEAAAAEALAEDAGDEAASEE